MPDNYLAEMLLFAKPIAHAIEQSFDCDRCGITVMGLEGTSCSFTPGTY
jgi:histidine triad (HIT) family protein